MLLQRALTTLLLASGLCYDLGASSLTLTLTGKEDGFILSTFVTTNPGSIGPGTFGIAIASDGNIITSNLPNGIRYVLKDVDGQTLSQAVATQPSDSGVSAYATVGGKAYGASGGQFVQFNNDGTVNQILTGVTARPAFGMWGSPANGHIIATSNEGIIDINPSSSGGFRVIANNAFGDGVSVSADGKTAFLEQFPQIVGYDIEPGILFMSPDRTSSFPTELA